MSGKRIQRKRVAGWRRPPGSVYVGRPSIFGNPFYCETNTQLAVDAYREWLSGGTTSFSIEPGGLQFARNAHPDSLRPGFTKRVLSAVRSLRGKVLVCWCPLDQPCHADVLLELANKPRRESKKFGEYPYRRYGQWAGNRKGTAYVPTRCAKEVLRPNGFLFSQCSRKNGHGPHGLFCKQHARQFE